MKGQLRHIGDFEIDICLTSNEAKDLLAVMKPFTLAKLRNHMAWSYGGEDTLDEIHNLVNLLDHLINP